MEEHKILQVDLVEVALIDQIIHTQEIHLLFLPLKVIPEDSLLYQKDLLDLVVVVRYQPEEIVQFLVCLVVLVVTAVMEQV